MAQQQYYVPRFLLRNFRLSGKKDHCRQLLCQRPRSKLLLSLIIVSIIVIIVTHMFAQKLPRFLSQRLNPIGTDPEK